MKDGDRVVLASQNHRFCGAEPSSSSLSVQNQDGGGASIKCSPMNQERILDAVTSTTRGVLFHQLPPLPSLTTSVYPGCLIF